MIGVAEADTPEDPSDDLLRVAERHASTRVPVTSRSEEVSALLARLRGNEYDSASVAAVCDGEFLVGVVAIGEAADEVRASLSRSREWAERQHALMWQRKTETSARTLLRRYPLDPARQRQFDQYVQRRDRGP